MSTADAIQDISDWLMEQGLSEGDYGEVLSGF